MKWLVLFDPNAWVLIGGAMLLFYFGFTYIKEKIDRRFYGKSLEVATKAMNEEIARLNREERRALNREVFKKFK